jgi:hypothetical protein
MAIVSRLQLNHPALGTTGGAGLHTSIESLYTKIGDNMNDRWFSLADFDQTETVDLLHNFEVDISNLVYDLWNYTGGEWVLLTEDTTPKRSDFSVIEKVGFEDTTLQITNNTGGNDLTFAVTLILQNLRLDQGDIKDIDITTTAPEEGQALVYEASSKKFKPGASGDASFKIQSVTDPNAVIKGGYVILSDGRELATYDGSGTASTDYGKDLTVSLDTILGSNPTDATAYYLYIDLDTLGSEVTLSDNGRRVFGVIEANFKLLTTKPQDVNRSRYVYVGFIKSATTGTVWSGSGSAFGTGAFRRHDNNPVAVNPVVYNPAKQARGTIGLPNQLHLGHYLSSTSFPSSIAASAISFFNLNADANDDSGNARNLTNNGTIPFTGTSILGTASFAANLDGVDDYFSSNSSFFVAGTNKSWSTGGCFTFADWTPAATQILIGQRETSNFVYQIALLTDGKIRFSAANSSATAFDLEIDADPNFSNGSKHSIALVYDYDAKELRGYIDGLQVAQGYLANTRTTGSPVFKVGSYGSTYADMDVEQVFFVNDALLKSEDIRKIASYRIDHNLNVLSKHQEWTANFYGNCATQDDQQWLVCKNNANQLFVDFSQAASTTEIELVCKDLGLAPTVIPAKRFEAEYTSNPTFPISHSLGAEFIPSILAKNASSVWVAIASEGYLETNATQITGDLQSLFDGGYTRVRVTGSLADPNMAVSKTSPSNLGLVTSYTPLVASSVYNPGDANYTVLTTDGYNFINYATTQTADRTITLPAANANNGRIIYICKNNSGAFKLNIAGTISGSSSNNFLLGQYARCAVISDGTNWNWFQEIIDKGTWTPTLITSGTQFSSITYTLQSGYWERIGKQMTLKCGLGWNNTTGSPTGFLAISGIAGGGHSYSNESSIYNTTIVQPDTLNFTTGTQLTVTLGAGGTDVTLATTGDNINTDTLLATSNGGAQARSALFNLVARLA